MYSRFVVQLHGDDDHGGGCDKMVTLQIVTMMGMTMMVMRMVIISSLTRCGEQGCW